MQQLNINKQQTFRFWDNGVRVTYIRAFLATTERMMCHWIGIVVSWMALIINLIFSWAQAQQNSSRNKTQKNHCRLHFLLNHPKTTIHTVTFTLRFHIENKFSWCRCEWETYRHKRALYICILLSGFNLIFSINFNFLSCYILKSHIDNHITLNVN